MGYDGQYKDIGNPNDMKFLDPSGQYHQMMQGYGDLARSLLGRIDNLTANPLSYTARYNPQTYMSTYDPDAYMRAFLGRSSDLANLVSGQQSQLQQSLNALAAQQAQEGGEAALAAMPGMRNSGAAMAAYAKAYANPFAQAQAQLQQNQLGMTQNLWNQAMGEYGQGYRFQDQQNIAYHQLNNANQQFLENLRFAAAQEANRNQQNLASMYGNLAGNLYGLQAGLLQNQTGWYQPTYEYQPGFWDKVGNIFSNYVIPAAGTTIGAITGIGGLSQAGKLLNLLKQPQLPGSTGNGNVPPPWSGVQPQRPLPII